MLLLLWKFIHRGGLQRIVLNEGNSNILVGLLKLDWGDIGWSNLVGSIRLLDCVILQECVLHYHFSVSILMACFIVKEDYLRVWIYVVLHSNLKYYVEAKLRIMCDCQSLLVFKTIALFPIHYSHWLHIKNILIYKWNSL